MQYFVATYSLFSVCQMAINSSCSCLMNKASERFQQCSWVRAGYINQAYSVVTLSPLYLSCCLLWMPSLWLVTFFSVWQIHHFGYLADLWFEGRHSCQLLIGEGHNAFSDLAVWCICFWRQLDVPPLSPWVDYSLLSSPHPPHPNAVTFIQCVLFLVVEMAYDFNIFVNLLDW